VSRELGLFYKQRTAEFRQDLVDSWAIRPASLPAVDADLRAIHRRYLGLACLGAILSQGGYRKDYIRGLAEGSYLAVILATKGLENPSSVLLRQSIELVLKHIYFANHSIEFHWSLTRQSYREISFQFLLDYVRKTDEFSTFPGCDTLLADLERQFHVFSRFVHMHSRTFIPYKNTSSVTSANASTISVFKQRSGQLWPLLVCLLIAYFPSKFVRANKNEQSVIVRSLGSVWHNRVKGHLHSLSS